MLSKGNGLQVLRFPNRLSYTIEVQYGEHILLQSPDVHAYCLLAGVAYESSLHKSHPVRLLGDFQLRLQNNSTITCIN